MYYDGPASCHIIAKVVAGGQKNMPFICIIR